MRKKLIQFWLSVVQTVFLLVIVIQLSAFGSVTPTKAVQNEPTLAPGDDAAPVLDMEALIDDDVVLGDENAPVTIVEWSDFQCPYCARFYSQTMAQIKEQYVKTGKVKFVYRDFPLTSIHPNAQKAAEAAGCAQEQGKFWEMHDTLFEKGVAGGVASFKQYAKELSLDSAKFDACLDSGKRASEVQKDLQDGVEAGITGTPGFAINGQVLAGALPFENFKQIIDSLLN